jgi:hypothetical protein
MSNQWFYSDQEIGGSFSADYYVNPIEIMKGKIKSRRAELKHETIREVFGSEKFRFVPRVSGILLKAGS